MSRIDDMVAMLDDHYPQAPARTKAMPGWMFHHGLFHFTLVLRRKGTRPHVILNDVWVPENRRGRGVATKAMQELCRWLDLYGILAALEPRAYDRRANGMTSAQLREFYGKHGFMPLTPGATKFWRKPK